MKPFSEWPRNHQGYPQPPILPKVIDTNQVWNQLRSFNKLTQATTFNSENGEIWGKNYKIWQAAVIADGMFRTRQTKTNDPLVKAVLAGEVNGYLPYKKPSDDFVGFMIMSLNGVRQQAILIEEGYTPFELVPLQEGEIPEELLMENTDF